MARLALASRFVTLTAVLALGCAGPGGAARTASPTPTPAPAPAPAAGAYPAAVDPARLSPAGPKARRRVEAYVTPYYDSKGGPDGGPQVRVGVAFDRLLASSRREDILAARDLVERDPTMITPMTMTVLAIRLYDVGLRDEAAFWYYAARERYRVLEAVLEVRSPGLASVPATMGAFSELVGPYVNGYTFCDLDAYMAIARRAVEWNEQHPYGALQLDTLTARPGDRDANLRAALAERRRQLQEATTFLADPAQRADIAAKRQAAGQDEKFCWR